MNIDIDGYQVTIDEDTLPLILKYKWRATKKRTHVYFRRTVRVENKNKFIYLHREIMNAPKGMVVDHISRNSLDNTKQNLRICTSQQNSFNRSETGTNLTSRHKGVFWHSYKKKWVAVIGMDWKKHFLGSFDKEIDAAIAYNKAATKFHKEFAVLNIIEPLDEIDASEGNV